ncbi:MAG: hypothetical protein FP816_15285 [Desulfobacteraceae bacterium]|nr:hypothetical protein [Desulfobacteraceae bacterium]MBU4055547.1 hypothetical protein [Pseudomonadota bacterium]
MKFDEAFSDKVGYGIGTKASIRGYLVVTDTISYLSESEDNENRAILVVFERLSNVLLSSEIPVQMGSMVLFSGAAEITGTLVKTGMGPLPVGFSQVDELIFFHKTKTIRIKPSET